MNSQNQSSMLRERFMALNDLQKGRLKGDFKNSFLMLRMIEFVESQPPDKLQSPKLISHLYKIDFHHAEYKIFENRFFKLRRKLLDYLDENTDRESVTNNMLPEEIEWRACLGLVNRGQKGLAFSRLEILEEKCWERNIFELLPHVIDRMIFINQSFNRIKENEPLYQRYKNATTLLNYTLEVLSKVRRIYEINYLKGISFAGTELLFVKKIADKCRNYPRFNFIYHLLSLYYKLGSRAYLQNMQVLGKHHKALHKIYLTHKCLPIFYIPNYQLQQDVHLREITMFYHYNKLEFEEAYGKSCELKEFLSYSSAPKTESFYYNAFRIEMASHRFQEAKKTLKSYEEVLTQNGRTERLSFVHTLLLALSLVSGKGGIKLENPNYSLSMLDRYLQWAEKNENLVFAFQEALIVKASCLLNEGKFIQAKKWVTDPRLDNYFENNKMLHLYRNVFNCIAKGKSDREMGEEFLSESRRMKRKLLHPHSFILLDILENLLIQKCR